MAVTAYRSPTATDISSGVTNPDNAWAEDDAYAVFTNINQFAQYSTWGDFSIPGGNSITGLELRVRGKHTGAGVNHALWAELSVNSGSTVSDPKDIDFNNTSEVEITVGGDGDLWGLSTPALTDFDGTTSNVDVTLTIVSFSVTSIDVDSLALRVYYDVIVNTFTKTFTADAIVKTIVTQTFTADAVFPALTINAPAYVGETAGDIVVTQPTTADVAIRVVGFGYTADELFFNPSSDFITHT